MVLNKMTALVFKTLAFNVLIVFTLLIVGTSKASASPAINVLPNPADFSTGGNVYFVLSEGALPTPQMWVMVVSGSPSGYVDVENAKGCGGSPDYSTSEAGFAIYGAKVKNGIRHEVDLNLPYEIKTTVNETSLGCNSTLRLNFSGLKQSTVRRYQGKYVALVQAYRISGTANSVNAFKIRVAAGNKVGYAAEFGAFSLQDRLSSLSPVSYADFNFEFAAPCELSTPTTVSAKWLDADYGTIQTNHSTLLEAYNTSGGLTNTYGPVSGSALGGNGTSATGKIDFEARNDRFYKWSWDNIHRSNGVQFFVPYESVNSDVECGSPPVCDVSYSVVGRPFLSGGNITVETGQQVTVRFGVKNETGSAWDNRATTAGLYQIGVATYDSGGGVRLPYTALSTSSPDTRGTFNAIDTKYRLNFERVSIPAGAYINTTQDWVFNAPASTGTYGAAWRVLYFPNAISSGPSANSDFSNSQFLGNSCVVNLTVEDPPPPPPRATLSCQAFTIAPVSQEAGVSGRKLSYTTFTSTNSLNISSVTYSITPSNAANTGMSGDGIFESPDRYNQDQDTRLYVPGSYTTTWTYSWTDLNYPTELKPDVTCSTGADVVTVTVKPLVCSVSTINTDINTDFRLSLTLTNPNLITIPISSSSWSAPGLVPPNGVGQSTSSGFWSVPSNGGAVTIYSKDVQAPNTGVFSQSWTVTTPWAGSNPNTAGCNTAGINTIIVREFSYARFYGNDVFAGGAYGDSCTVSGAAEALGSGRFDGAASHATYRGSASELAVFAAAQIDGVLPGSQMIGGASGSRSAVDELSFANSNPAYTTNTGTLQFGGGFRSQMCVDEFPTVTTGGTVNGDTDISGLDGSYNSGGLTITGGTIPNGNRPLIVVNGDVTIRSDITYATDNWGSAGDIPLVRIYATGNIYIDGSVTEISGLYSAKGQIYTCTNGSSVYDPDKGPTGNLDDQDILDHCSSKLTVYGAFTALRVNLWRTWGSVSGSPYGETADSSNIAESFVFSPEIYAALLDEDSSNTEDRFDSILSLPPAF